MATCPFCQGVVEAALTREGGPCPRCFNVIPGEDAVTDPGAAQRAREAAAQAARQRSQHRRSVLLAAAVLLSVAGGIGYTEHQRRWCWNRAMIMCWHWTRHFSMKWIFIC